MAIRQRKDRGTWQVYYSNPWTKKRESVSCGSLLEAQKTDDQIKFRLRWDKGSFQRGDEQVEEENDSLGGIMYAYLKERKLGKHSVGTIVQCTRLAVEKYGNKSISQITRKDLGVLLTVEIQTGVKATTVRHHFKLLRTVFMWAHKRGFLDMIPAWPELPEAHYEHFIPPSQEELVRMIEVAPEHIRRVIIIGSSFGMRVGPSELFKLRWEDVDLHGKVIRVRAARKNLEEPWREVPIKESLMPLLARWKSDDLDKDIESVITFHGKPVKQIGTAWKRVLADAGIKRRMRPYDLRHAFATEAIAAGADVGTVARLMGHADVTMVLRHYQHVMNAQKKAAIEAMPDMIKMCPSICAQTQNEILQ